MSVLTQEMSKQFLQSKNEGDKYKVIRPNNFFKKDTVLLNIEAMHYASLRIILYYVVPVPFSNLLLDSIQVTFSLKTVFKINA